MLVRIGTKCSFTFAPPDRRAVGLSPAGGPCIQGQALEVQVGHRTCPTGSNLKAFWAHVAKDHVPSYALSHSYQSLGDARNLRTSLARGAAQEPAFLLFTH